MTTEKNTKVSKKVIAKKVKKEFEGKEAFIPASGSYQIRELPDGTVMVYVKRTQKLLIRLMPVIGNPKAI